MRARSTTPRTLAIIAIITAETAEYAETIGVNDLPEPPLRALR